MYCVVPAMDTTHPSQSELPDLSCNHLQPFGGVAAWARGCINDPEAVNYAVFEMFSSLLRGINGHTVLVGDAAHGTTPHIAAGAAMFGGRGRPGAGSPRSPTTSRWL